jgi:hypothetical protein
VEVVAVKRASKKGVAFPWAELTGRESSTAPIKIAMKKLSDIICVVEIPIRCRFIASTSFYCEKQKETNFLISQLVPITSVIPIIITHATLTVKFCAAAFFKKENFPQRFTFIYNYGTI